MRVHRRTDYVYCQSAPPYITDQTHFDLSQAFTLRFKNTSLVIPAADAPNGSGATAYNYSDLWWNPAELGWGLQLNHHVDTGGNITGMVLLYDEGGNPEWFFIPGGSWTQNTFKSDVWKVTGPGGIGALAQFDTRRIGVNSVGNVSLQFNGQNSLTWTYTINGVSGSKQLMRYPF